MEKHESQAPVHAISESPSGFYYEMNIPFDMSQKDDAFQLSNLTRYICNGINDGYS